MIGVGRVNFDVMLAKLTCHHYHLFNHLFNYLFDRREQQCEPGKNWASFQWLRMTLTLGLRILDQQLLFLFVLLLFIKCLEMKCIHDDIVHTVPSTTVHYIG